MSEVIKKKYPILDENGQPSTYPTFASQVFNSAGEPLENADGEMEGVNAGKLGGKTWAERLLEIYPVGSIYTSVNSTSPASLFGGTWEQLKDRFLLGAGSTYEAGSTGGKETTTLSIGNLPADTVVNTNVPSLSGEVWYSAVESLYNAHPLRDGQGETNSQPINNMPPYLAVYMWKRVS